MKSLFILSLLALSSFCLQAQTNLDSLYAVWQDETQTDSVRSGAYNKYILDGFLFSQPDSAFQLAEHLVTFAKEVESPTAEIMAYNLQGISYALKSNNLESLKYFKKCLHLHKELGNKKGQAAVLQNIGKLYTNMSEFPIALDYYQQALSISRAAGNKYVTSTAMLNIGDILSSQGQYPNALSYYQQGLKLKKEIGDQRGVASALGIIGQIYLNQNQYEQAKDYFQKGLKINEAIGDKTGIAAAVINLGNIYDKQSEHEKALDYYQRGLKICKEIELKEYATYALNNIGGIYADQGKFDQAISYHEQALKMSKEFNLKNSVNRSLQHMGSAYNGLGRYQSAIDYCQQSYNMSTELVLIADKEKACECLYEAHKSLGKTEQALSYHEQMLVLQDSLKAEETNEQLKQMELKNQAYRDSVSATEKARLVQETHAAEIRKKNNTRNLYLAGGLFFLLLAGGLYSRNRYIKRSRDVIAHEKDRSDNLLLNILPAEIAEELKTKGSADAREYEQVSILFTDFQDFTHISEKLSAKDLVAEINYCFKAFDAICEKYAVEKIKTIGDSYMAAGGLPVPQEASVKNTVLAALEMAAFIMNRKVEREAEGKEGFAMRTGIHTGNVVAGIVGVKKFQYDVWGDTVNTASRMESSGEVGKVNISQFTYEILKDDPQFTFQYRGKVEAKGKGEVEMWFVEKEGMMNVKL